MKGQKICDKCQTKTGPRTKICKKCGKQFAFNFRGRKVKTNELKDWKSLERGDVVKSIQGHGPYWISSEGERESCGYFGLFRVRRVEEDGVGAYPYGTKQKHGGYHFIYMGKEEESISGTMSRSHKLELVKQ
jgi:ribosomal protein L40E